MKKPYSPWAYLYYLLPASYLALAVGNIMTLNWVGAVCWLLWTAIGFWIAYNWSQNKVFGFVPVKHGWEKSYDAETDTYTVSGYGDMTINIPAEQLDNFNFTPGGK